MLKLYHKPYDYVAYSTALASDTVVLKYGYDYLLRTIFLPCNAMYDKCKKLQFIHKLTASDTSKTAKNYKKVITPSAHRLNVNVLLSNITFL